MTSRPAANYLLLAAFAACTAHAGDIYKCTNAQGGLAFQDHSCAVGETETLIHMGMDPAPVSSGSDTSEAGAPPATLTKPGSYTPPPDSPLPALWVCTRPEDGTHYMSRDGITQPRMVPAGILGLSGQSLSSASVGGGMGVSAPGVRKIPVDKSPQAVIAGDYVAIQDQCDRATREQTCDYLHGQRDQIHEKLRRAFKDEQALLQPQENELDDQLGGC
jgi:hypothetical protein